MAITIAGEISLLIFILLPGFVTYTFTYTLLNKRIHKSDLEITMISLFFSLIIFVLSVIVDWVFFYSREINLLSIEYIKSNPPIIISMIFFMLVLVPIYAYIIQNDVFWNIRSKITKKTHKIVPSDVWEEVISRDDYYVIVETKNNEKLLGWISRFGYGEEHREIYLERDDKDYPIDIIYETHGKKIESVSLDKHLGYAVRGIWISEDDIKKIYFLADDYEDPTNRPVDAPELHSGVVWLGLNDIDVIMV